MIAVDVTKLHLAEAKLHTAKTMRQCDHAIPAEDGSLDCASRAFHNWLNQ